MQRQRQWMGVLWAAAGIVYLIALGNASAGWDIPFGRLLVPVGTILVSVGTALWFHTRSQRRESERAGRED